MIDEISHTFLNVWTLIYLGSISSVQKTPSWITREKKKRKMHEKPRKKMGKKRKKKNTKVPCIKKKIVGKKL